MRWAFILLAVSLVAGLIGFGRTAAGAPRSAHAFFAVAIGTLIVAVAVLLLGGAQG